jgi:integrase
MFPLYKPAKLYQGPKHWYVFYYFLIPGTLTYKRFKEYLDINRIKSPNERKIYGKEIVSFINKKLSEGFNPFTAISKRHGIMNAGIMEQLSYIYDLACEGQTENTIDTYKCMMNRFKKFISELFLTAIDINQVDYSTAQSFQKFMVGKQLSRKTINATISHLGLFWDVAKTESIVYENPFRNITKVKHTSTAESKQDIFEPLTTAEVKTVFNEFRNNGYINFSRFLAMIYLSWSRPAEIRRLKVWQIDLENNMIIFKKNETKNEQGAYVQIVGSLKKIFLEINLQEYDKDLYLFSNTFLPGIKPFNESLPRKIWTRIVRQKLNIQKAMYALKHTGNIEYLQLNKGNTNLKWQQSQNRHKTAEMTERYNRQLGAYFIDTSSINLGTF